MKIVYASNSFIPSKAANSVHVMKMCNAFAKLGHDVTLITNGKEKSNETENSDVFSYYGVDESFKIIEIPDVSFKNRGIVHGINKFNALKKMKPDLVYGRTVVPCALASLNGFKTVYEAHSPLSSSGTVARLFYALMSTSSHYKQLVVISDALKERYTGKQKVKILVAHDAASEADIEKKIELKGRADARKVGYVGHLYKGRGIDIMIECAKRTPKVDYHIVGGSETDIQYWKSYSEELGLINIFFHGHVSPSDAQIYRNSVDILTAPYQKEVSVYGGKGNTVEWMSPLKIFEYMASKKPIICSDLPVLREVLSNENSFLVNCDSVDEWVDAIDKLADVSLREKIAGKAYQDFITNYTWQKRAETILNSIVSV